MSLLCTFTHNILARSKYTSFSLNMFVVVVVVVVVVVIVVVVVSSQVFGFFLTLILCRQQVAMMKADQSRARRAVLTRQVEARRPNRNDSLDRKLERRSQKLRNLYR